MRQTTTLLILGTVLAAGCRETVPPPGRNLVITGSYSMAPLVNEMARRFEAAHPGVRVEVQGVGSARGISDTQQGLADLGMVARALRPDEIGNLHAEAIARDGICLVVPRTNPVSGLTDVQVIALFVRTATNWKQVSAPEGPLTVIGVHDSRGLAQAFLDHFKLKAGQVRLDVTAADGEQALKAVATQPLGIAYAPLRLAESMAGGLGLRLVPLNGVAPTTASLADGSYSFTRPLLLVTRDAPQGLTREFLEFARSPEVRDLVEKFHAAPPAP
jgi:phosphate transport system substrate-binding protein